MYIKSNSVIKELQTLKNPTKAKMLQGYFKTGSGEYAEGDVFLGVTVPVQRKIAKKYVDLGLEEIKKILMSNIHEHRFTALEILVFKYESASEKERGNIVAFYLKNTKYINNWDLVDTSAPYILGQWLLEKDRVVLYKLAKSKNIWERRISIVATYALIKNGDFKETLSLAEIFLSDTHDLIQKATGWMLREVGKKSESVLEEFLTLHRRNMPRTTLRYAIERFPKEKRKFYLSR